MPGSKLGKACAYVLGQWPKLTRVFDYGEVELDTNWAENSVRPLVLGRKNWLHVGSWEAGPRVAAIASVIDSSKRLGINPRDYLADVLTRLASGATSDVPSLTRPAARRPPANSPLANIAPCGTTRLAVLSERIQARTPASEWVSAILLHTYVVAVFITGTRRYRFAPASVKEKK